MKYVCRVRSSVKGGCDVQLSPRTVIVGPNGAGKTTIVQALELATSGFVSDMEGREMVRQSSALGRLFPDKGDMHAEATLADTDGGEERTFSWEMKATFSWEMKAKKNGGFYTPKHTAPVNVRFPVTDLTSTLKGDVNTVGVWLEGQVLAEDILSLLPPAVREDAKTAMDQHGCTDMLVLSKAAAQTAKNLRSQATRTEKTIDSLVEGVAPPMTEARRTEIEAKLAEEPPADSYTQAQVASMQAEVETLRAEARDLLAEIEALPVLDASTSAALSRLKNAGWLIQQHLQHFALSRASLLPRCGTRRSGFAFRPSLTAARLRSRTASTHWPMLLCAKTSRPSAASFCLSLLPIRLRHGRGTTPRQCGRRSQRPARTPTASRWLPRS
jgi:energy-coupling factor transporter ATP-binding protein EcfA2